MEEEHKINNVIWTFWLAGWGLVDAAQAAIEALDLTIIGAVPAIVINRIIDFIAGFMMLYMCLLMGIRLSWQRILSILLSFAAEIVPVLDVAPFWVGDATFIMLSKKAEEGSKAAKIANKLISIGTQAAIAAATAGAGTAAEGAAAAAKGGSAATKSGQLALKTGQAGQQVAKTGGAAAKTGQTAKAAAGGAAKPPLISQGTVSLSAGASARTAGAASGPKPFGSAGSQAGQQSFAGGQTSGPGPRPSSSGKLPPMSADESDAWHNARFRKPEEIESWRTAGYNPQRAAFWKSNKMDSPQESELWDSTLSKLGGKYARSEKVRGNLAARWKEKGYSPEEALGQMKGGVHPDAVQSKLLGGKPAQGAPGKPKPSSPQNSSSGPGQATAGVPPVIPSAKPPVIPPPKIPTGSNKAETVDGISNKIGRFFSTKARGRQTARPGAKPPRPDSILGRAYSVKNKIEDLHSHYENLKDRTGLDKMKKIRQNAEFAKDLLGHKETPPEAKAPAGRKGESEHSLAE